MPFESLSEKIQYSLRKLTGRGKVNEKDIDDAMREIRVSLLEADVNYKIVKQFISEVKEKALGERVMKSLTPGDQVVKIVYEELVKLMGEEAVPLNLKKSGISVILVVGLQGSGKTTHVGKLANYLRKNYKLKPLMVAADVYRPAAINQLVTIGKQLDIEVFEMGILTKPQVIAKKGLEYAKEKGYNVVLIDTAGRLAIDEALMQELVEIKDIVNPDEILLTVDAMTGQDAVNVATKFHEKPDVTGCLLTKLDSDTRGGAALSIRYMTQIPIKFTGIGEKMDEIDVFHPERMAKRILGMGDVLTFIEKAQQSFDEEEAMKMAEKFQAGRFTYNDFLSQIRKVKKMGSMKNLLGLIPGIGSQIKNIDFDEKRFVYIEAIIGSMTKEERNNPDLVNKSHARKSRIANGSGRSYQEINQLTKQFETMRTQMKSIMSMDEEQMEKVSKGQAPMPQMKAAKPKKGKGKNKGGFRF